MDIRTIEYRWKDDGTIHTDDVVVGDGDTVFDEDYEYDCRIFFYFHDEAEFQSAFDNSGVKDDGIEFTIIRVED